MSSSVNLNRSESFKLNRFPPETKRELAEFLLTFSGLAKVAIFTTNVDAENQTFINHKCVCGALNRHFCQTRVIGCHSFLVVMLSCQIKHLSCVLIFQCLELGRIPSYEFFCSLCRFLLSK